MTSPWIGLRQGAVLFEAVAVEAGLHRVAVALSSLQTVASRVDVAFLQLGHVAGELMARNSEGPLGLSWPALLDLFRESARGYDLLSSRRWYWLRALVYQGAVSFKLLGIPPP